MKKSGLLSSLVLMICLPGLQPVLAESGMLVNARIHTLDAGRPVAEAMAWDASGRLLAIGEEAEVSAKAGQVHRYDAGGAVVIPGLIDAHAHLMGLGIALMQADLVGTRSKAEIIERLKSFATGLPEGAWLLGRGWDQNDWTDQDFPTAADLDATFPERPVWLERIDGHAGWANSAALRRAVEDLAGDWQPAGGLILRRDGQPTGIFVDGATALIERAVPPADRAFRQEALRRALAAAAAAGLTGVHDMGTSLDDLNLYASFADNGQLTLRVVAYADGDSEALEQRCREGHYAHPGGRLAMRGVKFYADGALGSRGAALLAAYSDDPDNRGLLVTSPEELATLIDRARRCNLQVATHAIGDRGNRVVLETYAAALGAAAADDHRWRIEHAQVVAPEDIPAFASLGVVASVQPTHATSDMPWAGARLGEERLEGAYAWRSFERSGARLALGSDFPVEAVDPRLGLYSAVTRMSLDGLPPGGWLPGQALTAAEALRGFTTDAAWAGFGEGAVGRLAPGMRADFVLLDADPLTVTPAELPRVRVLSTWVDGQAVYSTQ
ncbi:MAG: amidohydrolase [Steroidobacteraceae bacterium]